MATPSFAERATQRKKWIVRIVVGAFSVTAATVAIAFWRINARREKLRPVFEALPHNVHQQLTGYSITRSEEGRPVFTVRAAKTLALREGGTVHLEDVSVEIFGREGDRHDLLGTHQCEYHPDTGDFLSSGTVEIELNAPRGATSVRATASPSVARGSRQPIFLETSRVSFRQGGSLLTTDQPVRFRVGSGAGSALGMTYATKEGWLELKKDIQVQWLPGATGSERLPVRLRATHLRYELSRGGGASVALDGPLEITQGARQVSGERAVVSLDHRNRATRASLEGHVRAAMASKSQEATGSAESVRAEFDPANGELRSILAEGEVAAESRARTAGGSALRQAQGGERSRTVSRLAAQQFEISFRGARPEPQAGRASGGVRVVLESPEMSPAPERKTLTASQVDFDFRAGGWGLKEMRTAGAGQLSVFPSDPKAAERDVTAGQLVIGFDRGARVKTLSGLLGTHVVFKPAPSAPPDAVARESFSQRLDALFNPATQVLSDVSQTGNFRFTEGVRQTTAERARYESATETFTFEGRPRMQDDESRVSAEKMTYDLRGDALVGVGQVQSVHLDEPQDSRPPRFDFAHRPERSVEGRRGGPSPAAQAAEPTHVLADRVVAQKRSQFARYEGHVRAWRGSTVIESAWLEVDRTGRRLVAGGPVSTSALETPKAAPRADQASGAPPDARPVLIRADHLEYFDESGKASYRGNVRFQTENTVLQADRLEVFFTREKARDLSGVERSVADGHVQVAQPARRATGEHAEYEAGAGKIVLTGGPPVLEDAQEGSTTGRRLTFFTRDDRLLVDGDVRSPVISKHRLAQ